jgi:ParB family chromosome partitioning protein
VSATTLFVADIQVGTRHRRELGDIDALAQNIAAVGLLHPIVVTPAGATSSGPRIWKPPVRCRPG